MVGKWSFSQRRKKGRDIKSKYLYRVSREQIIYNRLFAYRGSFAVVDDKHDGNFVSGEFPTFIRKKEYKDKKELSEYIVYCMNTSKYLD